MQNSELVNVHLLQTRPRFIETDTVHQRTKVLQRDAAVDHFVERLEQKQKEGYERFPVIAGEFSDWEDEQVWDD